jgi:hypothetical protein
MGPVIRPFASGRDPWWDATGRTARRRRRRRLVAWLAIVVLGMSLGLSMAQARTGSSNPGAAVPHPVGLAVIPVAAAAR